MLPEHTQSGFEADSWDWFEQQQALARGTDPVQDPIQKIPPLPGRTTETAGRQVK